MPTTETPERLLAVVVVYERDLAEVQAWPFLLEQLVPTVSRGAAEAGGFALEQILVYDNSAQARAIPGQCDACHYVHDADNGGTAAAYGRGCIIAQERGIEWLLLLDQDTALPPGFLAAAGDALASLPECHALVPWVLHGSRTVSPASVTDTGTIVPLQREAWPLPTRGLTAISSGTLLRATTLAECQPLPEDLWLDYVDHWIFAQLRARNLPVSIIDTAVEHDLSVATLDTLSPRRLQSILNGEAAFVAALGIKARLVYPFRLAARMLRYACIRPELAMHTLAWIGTRVLRRI